MTARTPGQDCGDRTVAAVLVLCPFAAQAASAAHVLGRLPVHRGGVAAAPRLPVALGVSE